MKKIWPWLLALILLIIFCVWTKKDTIQVSSHSPKAIKHTMQKPVTPTQKHYINYEIVQNGDTYTLNGNFTNVAQQQMLSKAYITSSNTLKQGNTSTNETLLGEDAIALTNKIIPHFIQHYSNGKLVYSNRTLQIFGEVDSYEAQHEMQRLLNASTISSQDNSTVTVKKPIQFHIDKQGTAITMKGKFSNDAQSTPLRNKLPATANIHLSKGKNRIDNGAIAVTQNILPFFMQKYTHGSIDYTNETLTVTGMVASQSDLNSMHTLLSNAGMPIVDHTTVDKKALAEAAAQEAKIKAQEMEKRAQEAKARRLAETRRVAQEAEARRLAEARRVAQEAEARRLAEARRVAQEAEARRLAEARRVAQEAEKQAAEKKAQALKNKQNTTQTEAETAKRNIINLLKIQNIEFEVAKGSLTPRGKGTVDKLANILKQYPHIKIEIAGHTDSDGSASFNQKLSQSRVDTVKKRLISQHIAAHRLTAKGYGESQPLVPNTSDENKQRNRRVEINIQGE